MFQVRVKVSNPYDSWRFFEEKFWVDTGALYSYIPEDRLKDIGLAPSMTKAFRHADMRRERLLAAASDRRDPHRVTRSVY